MLKQLEPCEEVADLVEKASAMDKEMRNIAIRNGVGVRCDYCACLSGTYACPCYKAAYCNQKCQAAHWNVHACDKKQVQLVGLSDTRYNGEVADRLRYNRKKRRYVVLLGEREVLVDPLKTYVLS